jgi:transposase-like protein
MGHVLHGCARTTQAVRLAIQSRQESVRTLTLRYGISPTTIQKWRKKRMNRNIKDPTVKRCHYGDHQQLIAHLELFVAAYNHARRLKTLKGLTPYQYLCRTWTEEPEQFKVNPCYNNPGLNT